MKEIICPNCNKPFTIDENSYADIIRQVRDEEFSRALDERTGQIEAKAAAEFRAEKAEMGRRHEHDVAKREEELQQRKGEIELLKAQLSMQQQSAKHEREAEVQKALADAHATIMRLEGRLEAQAHQAALEKELALADVRSEAERAQRDLSEAVKDAQARIELEHTKAEAATAAHKEELAMKLQVKQDEIAERDRTIETLRTMRRELSMKMLGENLEQYCENEFNKLRPTAFQTAQFGKDNDSSGGSKGDYIYRELDQDGSEIVSIMFEMKTEADDSNDRNRKRNSDHFAKLDRDRRAKGCEYAVLVSELELENDLYEGITDVSFQSGYEKMYVIRPKSFISMITLIRNAAISSLSVRRELEAVRQRDLDVTHFEERLDDFKGAFGESCRKANDNFQKAIKDIDDTIKKLERIREELRKSGGHLDAAENKLDKLTRRSLSYKNKTVAEAFKDYDERKAAGLVEPYVPLIRETEEDPDVIEAELIVE